jgi:TonB family protein
MNIRLLPRYVLFLMAMLLCAPVSAQQPGQASGNRECTAPVYSGKAMDRKAKILAKPDPDYDQADRRTFAGEVVTLNAILCGSGEVTDVKVKNGPADSVNAKAVEAARKIRFVPAEKDGEKASTAVVLLYRVD